MNNRPLAERLRPLRKHWYRIAGEAGLSWQCIHNIVHYGVKPRPSTVESLTTAMDTLNIP